MNRAASLLVLLSLLGTTVTATRAEEPRPHKSKLTTAEQKSSDHCLTIIRNAQLPDGAFNMVHHGTDPGHPVWVAPYFADHAALALLAGHAASASPEDVGRVGKWLAWRVTNQEEGGFWFDHTGTNAGYKSNKKVDAHDSSAALFLVVLDRYRQAGGKVTEALRDAAKRSHECIRALADRDGLTFAKPDYKVKYLMDNIEVEGGLLAASRVFAALGDPARAKAATGQAEQIARGLKKYWEAKDEKRFAWALHPSGQYDGGFAALYPHGLAQLFGCAFLAPERDAFLAVEKKFPPETTAAGTGAERFLIAVSRCDAGSVSKWRATTADAGLKMKPNEVYLFRPSLVVLGLLEGADWLPSVLSKTN